MMEWKTYFTDSLVQVAILLSLFRSDWNNYFNSSLYDGYPEVQEIIMGPLSGYTQTSIRANEWHSGSIGLSHPKSMSFDYSSSIFQDIHSLSRYQHFDTEINAFLVGENQTPNLHSETAHISPSQVHVASADPNNNQASQSGGTNSSDLPSPLVEGAEGPQNRSETFSFEIPGAELTKEDMDLIEILWRQDIDLGVERDAYDATRRLELEKQKENELSQHREKEEQLGKKQEQESKESSHVNVTYIQDNETGEMIPVPVSTDCPIPVASHVPFTHAQQPPPQQPNQSSQFSLDEAMHILEDEVDNFSLSDRLPEPPSQAVNEQLQELENLIGDVADMYGNRTERPALQHQNSIEQHWQDISNLLPMENTSNDTVLNELTSLLDGYTATNTTGLAQSSLIQNASLVPPQIPAGNLSFNEAFNYTETPSQSTSMNMTEPLELMSSEALGLQTTSMSTTAAYVNSTDALLQQLLRHDIVDLADMNITEGSSPMETNVSSDSAISSADSASLRDHSSTASPSQIQELNDIFSDISSPYDTLEGATGGSDADDSGNYDSLETKLKYETDYLAGQMNFHSNDQLRVNHSDSSNATYSGYETTDNARQVQHNHTYPLQPGQTPKERRSKKLMKDELDIHDAQYTRDEKRAKAMKIPLSMEEMISSPVELFSELLENHRLSETQLQLIRDIRRRGKNKVAAQNCRRRKLEVIQALEDEVETMREERDRLRNQRRQLGKETSIVKHKYSLLYEDVFRNLRDDQGNPYDRNEFALQQNDEGELLLIPHNATFLKDEPKNKGSRKRKHDRKGH